MSALKNMAGQRVNMLLVVRQAVGSPVRWHCLCDCGKEAVVLGAELRKGQKSCGCLLRREKHGGCKNKKKSPEYKALKDAIQRCENPKHPEYPRYGGRGISVCPEWKADFGLFLAEVGLRPGKGLSLDRIDVDKGYEPGNCRWAEASIQGHNKRAASNTGVLGVSRTEAGRFLWCLKRKGRRTHGYCDTLDEAIAARGAALPLLYPEIYPVAGPQ